LAEREMALSAPDSGLLPAIGRQRSRHVRRGLGGELRCGEAWPQVICVLCGASRRCRIQAWRGVNELPGRELMRGGRWRSGASAGRGVAGLRGSTA